MSNNQLIWIRELDQKLVLEMRQGFLRVFDLEIDKKVVNIHKNL